MESSSVVCSPLPPFIFHYYGGFHEVHKRLLKESLAKNIPIQYAKSKKKKIY
jgi:hypothetical protein